MSRRISEKEIRELFSDPKSLKRMTAIWDESYKNWQRHLKSSNYKGPRI